MPLMRRRPVLRAAAVGGGAYAMGKRNARIREQQEAHTYEQGRQAGAAAPPAPPAAGAEQTGGAVTTRLAELGKLHDQGVLTDEEFAQAKAKLLGL
jgi:hypothetical protein